MPVPPQNLERQLFYFEGALVRHLEAPQSLPKLEATGARRHYRDKSGHRCVDFVQSEPDMVQGYLRGLIFFSSHLVNPSRGAM